MKLAIERNHEKRAEFLIRVGEYEANQLVFVDESYVDCRLAARDYGWAPSGQRVMRYTNFTRGER